MDSNHCSRNDVDNFLLLKQLGGIASDVRKTLYKKPSAPGTLEPPALSLLPAAPATILTPNLLEKATTERGKLPELEKRTPSPLRETAHVASILFTRPETTSQFTIDSPIDSQHSIIPDRKRTSSTDLEPVKVQKKTETSTRNSQIEVAAKGPPYLTRLEQQMITDLRSSGEALIGNLLFTLEHPDREVTTHSKVICEDCKSRMIVQSVRGHMVTRAHR